MSDAESFARLYYAGTVQLGMTPDDFWLCPIGLFLDLWACHKQWLGLERPYIEADIDSVLPAFLA
ncbi:hypothetical protein AGMMS49992_31550 [Clostridia bacterium]|nr:hypothetical protein AGMMS49992_31550 [Clostridia bacterium]